MVRQELTTEQVQRWVVTFLVLAVSMFPLGAMAAAVVWLDGESRRGDATLINVMMAVLGTIALVVVRLVHQARVPHPVLALGLVPAALVALLAR